MKVTTPPPPKTKNNSENDFRFKRDSIFRPNIMAYSTIYPQNEKINIILKKAEPHALPFGYGLLFPIVSLLKVGQ